MPTYKEKRLAEALEKKVDAMAAKLDKQTAAEARALAATVKIDEACTALNVAMQALASIVFADAKDAKTYRELRDIEKKLRQLKYDLEDVENGKMQLDAEPKAAFERRWLQIAAPWA